MSDIEQSETRKGDMMSLQKHCGRIVPRLNRGTFRSRTESRPAVRGRRARPEFIARYSNMRKLQIGIVDIVSKAPTRALYARVMNATLASIMPQAIGVWCRQLGHDVSVICYTGFEDLLQELLEALDLLFVGAFTEAAHTTYALVTCTLTLTIRRVKLLKQGWV